MHADVKPREAGRGQPVPPQTGQGVIQRQQQKSSFQPVLGEDLQQKLRA